MAEAAEAGHPDPLRYRSPPRLKLFLLLVLCVFAAILAWGLITRFAAAHALAAQTGNAAIPVVSVITPQSGNGAHSLVLPGNVRAFTQAPIYAQVSGYLKNWNFDIGAPVQAGDILAEISTPDLDQQLIQAKADLVSAQANETLSASTARRWNDLLKKDAVSQQDADEKNGDLAAKIAAVDAAKANVQRLEAQEAFKKIIAPFTGIVTARNTDVGALITVGGQTPLFTVDDEQKLRIYVDVPQVYSAEVTQGASASFTVPEYPGQSFTAKLVSTAGAVDPVSGALLVQFQTDNSDHRLHPGDYAQVSIPLSQSTLAISVPPTALMFRDAGMQVAILGPGNHADIKTVQIARDLGTSVILASGLSPQDKVIDNPPDSLEQGDLVRVAQPAGSANAH